MIKKRPNSAAAGVHAWGSDAESARFFGDAARRLRSVPTRSDIDAAGDHALNAHLASLNGDDYRDAAVLVPVIDRSPASVLLTVRNSGLSSHAGQIAFPGGKIDAGDGDPSEAALRETEEEIGLDRGHAEVVGYLDTYLSRTGYRIVPVLARVEPNFALAINRDEVDDVFEVPLAFLLDGTNYRKASRDFGGQTANFYEILYEERYIWGVTAGIIRTLYNRMVN